MSGIVIRRGVVVAFVGLAMGSMAFADELSTARRFEKARGDEPSLIAFLRAMPKGGDLHRHFPAGIFAEEALRAAIRRGLFFDPVTSRFETETAPGRLPADRLLTDDALRFQFLNAASMRGPIKGPAGGHDKFFQTFGALGSAIPHPDMAQLLVEVVHRARLQNIQYLELQAGPGSLALERVKAAALVTDAPEELLRRLQPQIDGFVVAAKEELDRWEREVTDKAKLDQPVEIRYQMTAFRTDPDARIMATLAAGFALIRADPRVVGVNFAGPEDHPIAQEAFDRQMRIVDALWRQFARPNLALHAGELNLWLSPVEPMTSRIRRSRIATSRNWSATASNTRSSPARASSRTGTIVAFARATAS
jgi:adenosine deaminase